MDKACAALGSAVFFILVPCVVAGLGPYLVTGWHIHGAGAGWEALHVVGGLLLAVGATVLLRSFARLITEGLGTPAPIAPTQTLVVGGLYRYVRNPMYVAIDISLIGQSLLFGRLAMLWYTAAIVARWRLSGRASRKGKRRCRDQSTGQRWSSSLTCL